MDGADVNESCANRNLRQPDKPCNLQKSEWDFLFAVVHSWARHALTNYDALVTPQSRETLRAKIDVMVANAYPWLRLERDPAEVSMESFVGNPSPASGPLTLELSRVVGRIKPSKMVRRGRSRATYI